MSKNDNFEPFLSTFGSLGTSLEKFSRLSIPLSYLQRESEIVLFDLQS